jgi:hypothetical protein
MSVGPREVRLVVAGDLRRADRLHELLAVARELVDGMRAVVHEPVVPLGIVRADDDPGAAGRTANCAAPTTRISLPLRSTMFTNVIPARMAGRILLGHVVARRVASGTTSPGSFKAGRHPRAKTMTRSWLSAPDCPRWIRSWKPEPHQFCGHPATSSYGPVVSPPPFSLGNCCASMTP